MESSLHHATPRRGEIWMAYASSANSSATYRNCRPYLIVSNNKWSEASGCYNVIPITGGRFHRPSPSHVNLPKGTVPGLVKNSTVMCENATTLPQAQMLYKIGQLNVEQRKNVAIAQVLQNPDIAFAFGKKKKKTTLYQSVAAY